VLATGNAGKVREFNRLLAGAFEVRPLPAGVGLPPETGDTFATNARLKAQSVFDALGRHQAVLADDSGLEVAALGGRPGIFSARFAGEEASDADNVAKLLQELSTAPDRGARFVCALCLIVPPSGMVEVEGMSKGSITLSPRGEDGFGYDPVFQPEGWALTLAEASPEDKDSVSHRGAAARALVDHLYRQTGA
jgi:non-canonical purine NTP pyrophosphatase (RdgB/HAM1 family)